MNLLKPITAAALSAGILICPGFVAAKGEGLSLTRKTPGANYIGSLQLEFDGLRIQEETTSQVYSYNAPTGRMNLDRSVVYDLGFIPRRILRETPETTIEYGTRQVPTGRMIWSLTSSTSGHSLSMVLDKNGKLTGIPTLATGMEQGAQSYSADLEIVQLIHQHKSNALGSSVNFLPLIFESVTPANPLYLKLSISAENGAVVTKLALDQVSTELGQALNAKRNYSGTVNCSANVIASVN